jgi:glycosyltransferase involved in cell wall biosynthesis
MRVALITRSTLYAQPGGDTIQVCQTAAALTQIGIDASICLTGSAIDYSKYDLLHFFNLTRPADILLHARRSRKPYVVTPILVEYSAYDAVHRNGMAGKLFRYLDPDTIEYAKTMARWLAGRDVLASKSFLWKGQRRSIVTILKHCKMVLPNSLLEYRQLCKKYRVSPPCQVVPNGVDTGLFRPTTPVARDKKLVLCVGRIEGIKNQSMLIRALSNTPYHLILIGSAAKNQQSYHAYCRKIAGNNVTFIDHLPQEQLVPFYQRAKIHVQPSWFETCGLSSLEAAASGCNLVLSDTGYVREYYENFPVYCNPADPAHILDCVEKASASPFPQPLMEKIITKYTWSHAAKETAAAYERALNT